MYVSAKVVCVMGGQRGSETGRGALRLPSLVLMAKFSSTNLWHLL